MKPKMVRQGDVLLVPCTAQGRKKRTKIQPEGGRLILARGEATGHHHSVDARGCDLFQVAERVQLVVRQQPTPLKHQEHSAVEVVPGTYWVIGQREYSPQEIRRVRD